MQVRIYHGTPAQNREEWLNRAADVFAQEIRDILGDDVDIPSLRVSCAFPVGTRGGTAIHSIGQCWAPAVSADGTHEIFISPTLAEITPFAEEQQVTDVLLHELIHAVAGLDEGHRGKFKEYATKLGLEGPMTATHAGESLSEFLAYLPLRIGPYPHARMDPFGRRVNVPPASPGDPLPPIITDKPPKQGTRMLKMECVECGWIVRTTRSRIDQTDYENRKCWRDGGQMEEV